MASLVRMAPGAGIRRDRLARMDLAARRLLGCSGVGVRSNMGVRPLTISPSHGETELTARQRAVLTHAAGTHGIYPHSTADRTVLENLWLKELVLPTCNG